MRRLSELPWTELTDVSVVVVPVGSTEQHGPHLPADVDTRIAVAVAERAAAGNSSLVLAPAVAFGASGEHQEFPGTLSIGHDVLRMVLIEIGRSAGTWADRILFVNGHGGNLPSIADAVERLRYEGRDAAWFGCDSSRAARTAPVGQNDAHAGHSETSMMLALEPGVVRSAEMAAGDTRPLREIFPTLRTQGVRAVSGNGVLGDPTTATAADGARILQEMVASLVERIERWRPDGRGHLV